MVAFDEKSGQGFWSFEELDLEGTMREVDQEYRLLREKISFATSLQEKRLLIKKAGSLLDVSHNLCKLLGWVL